MSASKPAKLPDLPTRLKFVLVLLGISVAINYIDRGNLAVAASLLKDELHLSPSQLGMLLSAFFWTYACMQPVAGWLVDRLNVNWVIATGFLLWSLATAFTGMVHSFVALFAVRLLLGIGESVAYPSYSKILANHFPEEHRGRANSVISAGSSLGPGLGILAGGMLMARFGWRSFFIALGLGSLFWLLPWARFMPKAQDLAGKTRTAPPKLSEFLRMRSAWGTCFGLFSSNYAGYFLISWLPYFLVKERHFSMDKMSAVGAATSLIAAVAGIVSGWLSDRWIAQGSTPTFVRKFYTAAGLALAGFSIGISPLLPGDLAIVSLCVGSVGLGMCGSNIWAISQTLAGPDAAGRWTGFQNFVGNLSGVVGPAITGFALQKTGHFAAAFAILSVVAFLGSLNWIFVVGSIEPVQWGQERRVHEAAHA